MELADSILSLRDEGVGEVRDVLGRDTKEISAGLSYTKEISAGLPCSMSWFLLPQS